MNKTDLKNIKAVHFAPNHIIILTPKGKLFQSYNSVVAIVSPIGATTLGRDWDYSRTTMKYLGQWIDMNAKEIRKAIKDGGIKYDANLI